MQNKVQKGFKSIQALRTFACVFVILSHYQASISSYRNGEFTRLHFFDWGASGVDLFFVISGFIMAYTTRNNSSGLRVALGFMLKRVIRIFPAYYFWLLISFCIAGGMSVFHYQDKLASFISALTFHPNTANTPPNYIADDGFYIARWTLNYEIYFYIIFTISLFFSHYNKIILSWALFAAIIYPLAICGHITLSTSGYHLPTVMQMFYTNPIILEFIMGIVTCYTVDKLGFLAPKYALILLLIITAIFLATLFTRILHPFSLLTGLIFSLILILSIKCELTFFCRTPRFVLALGDMSYSLYLSHLPVAMYFHRKFPDMYNNLSGQLIMILAMFITTIIVSSFTYKYIEKKLVRMNIFRVCQAKRV